MGNLTTTTDEWTDLRRARRECIRLDCLGTYRDCTKDPRECGTYRRLTAPRPALVPSVEQMERTNLLWADVAKCAALVIFFLVILSQVGIP